MPQALCLGKKPAVERPKDFRFTAYREEAAGIVVPPTFGFGSAFAAWGMLGNDNAGDCVWAGADHETMLLNWLAAGAQVGQPSPVEFATANAISDYSATTGYDPSQTDANGNNPTDQGTEVGPALDYRRKTGVIDANGKRHKIAAYVKIDPGNLAHLLEAVFLFEAVGIGIEFPGSAMDQFNSGEAWDVVPGASIDGGHYVPLVGRPATGLIDCVTWGKTWHMTDAFFSKYCDEAYAVVSLEGLQQRTATNWGGYNWQQLVADAGLVGVISNDPGPGPVPTPAPPAPPAPTPSPTPTPLTPEQIAYFNWGFNSGWNARGRHH